MTTATNTSGPRERLLEAASRLFYQQGYHATGVNQLIDEADVAKASFYDHFDSKEALAETYLAEGRRRWREMLDAHLARYDDPRERLVGLFDFLKERKEKTGYRGCAFLNTVAEVPSPESPLREQAARHYDAFRQIVRRLVDDYASSDRPDLSEDDRNELAEGVVLLFQGALVSSQNYTAPWPIEAARTAAERLLAC